MSIHLYSQPSLSKKLDSLPSQKLPDKNRNMFGLGVQRGLIKNDPGTMDGYILYAVPTSPLVYLINRKGEVVHQWKGSYAAMASVAYLQDDGSIIENAVDPDFPVFAGGGEAGRIEKISWDNKLLWDFEYATEQYLHHHDFSVMPNGHILAIAWEAKTAKEVLDAGRKPELIPKAGLWPDKIVEIEPLDKWHGKVVWEWHIWDHIIQDRDAQKPNFGNPADHPERMDVNVGEPLPPLMTEDSMETAKKQGKIMWRNQTPENMGSDIYHFNAIKYNPDLDQIVFSSPHISEIFIIDHSTTTAEAAGHKGGRWGKGGDFLYRWGNPQNYKRGDSSNEVLFGQHDVRWIEKGMPGEGHLTLFNNNHYKSALDSINYSEVMEIQPPTDAKGNYYLEKNKTLVPKNRCGYIPRPIHYRSGAALYQERKGLAMAIHL